MRTSATDTAREREREKDKCMCAHNEIAKNRKAPKNGSPHSKRKKHEKEKKNCTPNPIIQKERRLVQDRNLRDQSFSMASIHSKA